MGSGGSKLDVKHRIDEVEKACAGKKIGTGKDELDVMKKCSEELRAAMDEVAAKSSPDLHLIDRIGGLSDIIYCNLESRITLELVQLADAADVHKAIMDIAEDLDSVRATKVSPKVQQKWTEAEQQKYAQILKELAELIKGLTDISKLPEALDEVNQKLEALLQGVKKELAERTLAQCSGFSTAKFGKGFPGLLQKEGPDLLERVRAPVAKFDASAQQVAAVAEGSWEALAPVLAKQSVQVATHMVKVTLQQAAVELAQDNFDGATTAFAQMQIWWPHSEGSEEKEALNMPAINDLNVSVWSSNGRFCALLWWPSIVALCAEKDKNLDMSGQLHQVRMRRPDYEHDAGWIESQVKRTVPPVTLRRTSCGTHAPHSFDLCHLLDDSILPEELNNSVLPRQAFGAFRCEECLTYEFSVRVSDGYRWSEWSPPSARCCFAVEPKIVTTCPVELDELQRALTDVPDVVSPAESIPELSKALTEQLTFTQEGDMEPPHWVAIVVTATAQLSEFLVSWPNLPPSAYSQPDTEILPAVKQMSETGDLAPFLAPPLVYRINVWMVGLSPDAADVDHHQVLQKTLTLEEADAPHKDLLYRQYDVPPSAYPDPVDYDEPTVTRLTWHLPTLPPDKTYRCTVEGRFETNTSVHWWTPLMKSGPFVVERVPPPTPPELVPVAELPTPEQEKLLARLTPHSNAWLAVRWPWRVQGRHVDILKESSHVLEYCQSDALQSLRDPSAEPVNTEGETAMKGRALGRWHEAKSMQICFVHFVKNEVVFELPPEASSEPNWVPVLVASGLWPAEGEPEPESVHLRWRYRAGLAELASTNSCLHFSAASGPVRTMIAQPGAVEVYMAVQERASRLAGYLHWNAWRGSEKHQFSYRILSNQKKSQRHVRGLLSESTDTLDGASGTPKAAKLHAVTGWIELPPVHDDIKRKLEMEPVEPEDPAELLVSGEASRVAHFQRKLAGTEWQPILWRHYHQKQEEFWDPASRDHEVSWQYTSSLSPAHDGGSRFEGTERSSLGGTKTRDVPFRIRPSHALEWRVRVSDGMRWSNWSNPSEPQGLAPPIPKLAGPVRLIFNRREPTVVKVVWSACEVMEGREHLMDSIEYLVFMAIDENSGRELIQDEGNFDVNRLHNWGVHLSDGSCGRLLPFVGEEGDAVAEFDFEALFSETSQKRLLGKFRHKEMRSVSAEGDGGPPTVQGFELLVSGLKPHCMHRISVVARCAVENLPEPDWQRLKLDPSHPLRWSDPFHSSPLLTPLRPPPMLVPELVPIPDGRFGRFLHTPCILLKCGLFAKQNKNDSDKDHSVVVDCRPAGSTDEDQRAAMQWVHRNIGAFGGNASDLLLFGESAGAGSIAVHLTSPLSWPWYRRVIMESGAFSYWNAQPMADAESQFQELLEATKCDGSVECLLKKAADELIGISTVELNPEPLPEAWKAYGTFFSPTVDGVQLLALPWQLLQQGKFNPVEVLLGFNKDEGTVLPSCEGTPKCQILHKGAKMTESDFKSLMTTDLFNVSRESKLEQILKVYAPELKENGHHEWYWYWIAADVYGDYAIACPTLRAADRLSEATETYLYCFAHTPESPAPKWAGIFGENGTVAASHAAELGFVWLGGDGWNASVGASEGGWKLEKDEWPLAETVATYWTNFAKSGNPNLPRNGTSLTIPWTLAPHALDFRTSQLHLSQLSQLRRRCELLDSLGPMVEGYTQERRLKSKDESKSLLI